jgi:cell division protein FtsI (penicillin-binding protein 3)
VTLIAVDDPQRTYWGEIAAAPAFRKVMSFTLSYFNVPPDNGSASAAAQGESP